MFRHQRTENLLYFFFFISFWHITCSEFFFVREDLHWIIFYVPVILVLINSKKKTDFKNNVDIYILCLRSLMVTMQGPVKAYPLFVHSLHIVSVSQVLPLSLHGFLWMIVIFSVYATRSPSQLCNKFSFTVWEFSTIGINNVLVLFCLRSNIFCLLAKYILSNMKSLV